MNIPAQNNKTAQVARAALIPQFAPERFRGRLYDLIDVATASPIFESRQDRMHWKREQERAQRISARLLSRFRFAGRPAL